MALGSNQADEDCSGQYRAGSRGWVAWPPQSGVTFGSHFRPCHGRIWIARPGAAR